MIAALLAIILMEYVVILCMAAWIGWRMPDASPSRPCSGYQPRGNIDKRTLKPPQCSSGVQEPKR